MYQGGKVYVRRTEVDGWTAGTVIKVGPRNLYKVQNSDNSKVIRLCPKSELKPLTIQLSEAYKEGTPVMYYDHEKERWMHGTLLGASVGLGKVQFLSQRARGEVILWFEEKDIRDSYPMSDEQSASSSEAVHTLLPDHKPVVKKNALYQESEEEEDENVMPGDGTSLHTAPEVTRSPYSPPRGMGLPQSASWSYYPKWDTLTHPFFSIPFTGPPSASFPNAYELNATYTKTRHRTQQQQRPARTKLTSRGIPAHPSSHFFKNSQLSANPFMQNYQATQAAMLTQLLGYQYQLTGLAPWLAATMMNPHGMPPHPQMAPHATLPTQRMHPNAPPVHPAMNMMQLGGTMGHAGGWGNLPYPSQPPRSMQQAMRKAQTSLRPEKVRTGRPYPHSATGKSWGVPPPPKHLIPLGESSEEEEEEEARVSAQSQPSKVGGEKKRKSRPSSRPGSASKTQPKGTPVSKKQVEELPSSPAAVGVQRPQSIQSFVGEPPVLGSCSNDDIFATVGKSILISCTAEGDPPPSFTWRHHSNLITPDDPHYQFPSAGFLLIPTARESDSGYYTCTVMNVCGSVSKCFHIEVKYAQPAESGSPRMLHVSGSGEDHGSTGSLLDFKTKVSTEEVAHLTPKLQRANAGPSSPKERSKQPSKVAKEVSFQSTSVPVYIPHSKSMPMEDKSSDPEEDTSGVGTLETNTLSSTMRSGDSNTSTGVQRRETPSSGERRPRVDSFTTYLFGADYGSKSQPDLTRSSEVEFYDGMAAGMEHSRNADIQSSEVGSEVGGIRRTGSDSALSTSKTAAAITIGGQDASKLDTSMLDTMANMHVLETPSELATPLLDEGPLAEALHPGVVVTDEHGHSNVEVVQVVASGIDDSEVLRKEEEELQLLQDQLEQEVEQLQYLGGQAQLKPAGGKRSKQNGGFLSKVWKRLRKSSTKQESTSSQWNSNDAYSTAL